MMESPQIISMDFSTSGRDDCYYRILVGTNVKYITIQAGALDAEALLDMPLSFQQILPSLPYDRADWNQAYISRSTLSGELESNLTQSDLPGVQTVWHSEKVNFLNLERTRRLSLLAQECVWKREPRDHESGAQNHQTVIAKMARFPWEIRYIEAETRIYQHLNTSARIAPKFLGHIYEADRVIGFLLEKVEGRYASAQDLEICKTALRHLHGSGILHGDCNRHNFIVGTDGEVTLIDFEKAKVGAEAKVMEEELGSLEAELCEDSGRGGGFAAVESD